MKYLGKLNRTRYYFEKRTPSVIIGVNMQRMSKWYFSAYMGCATVDYGYDLMLTDSETGTAISVGSQKGGANFSPNTPTKT
jgi:hypothetical protein